MKTFKGGTFDTILGKLSMTGTKKLRRSGFLGEPRHGLCDQGGKEVYLGEEPMTTSINCPDAIINGFG